jgi:hypothetical protein
MDGRLLHELLLEDEVEHVQAAAEFVVKAPDRQFDYSAEEAEEISQRLRSLGYL